MLIAILYARKLRPIVCVRLKVSELNWPGEIKKYRNFDIDDFQDFENLIFWFLILKIKISRYQNLDPCDFDSHFVGTIGRDLERFRTV